MELSQDTGNVSAPGIKQSGETGRPILICGNKRDLVEIARLLMQAPPDTPSGNSAAEQAGRERGLGERLRAKIAMATALLTEAKQLVVALGAVVGAAIALYFHLHP